MKFSIVIFCFLVVLLLGGVIPTKGALDTSVVYRAPVFIFLLAVLSASSVWCCIKRKFSLKQVGFYLVHLGVVAILAGAFIGYLSGKKGMLQLQLFRPVAASGLMDKPEVEFGFDVAAKDFEVEFYPPVYHLYHQVPEDQVPAGQMPFEKIDEFSTAGNTEWNIDGFGPFQVSNLWSKVSQEWTRQRRLDDGVFLYRASQTPSHYGVMLQISDGDQDVELPISINHPAGYNGWRFYLMSYDQQNRSYVILSARHDPGRNAVVAGIWIVMAGMFVLCFRREGGAV